MRISIVGLGWLGEPLARFLVEKGHEVLGSTTSIVKSERLTKEGINACPFFLNPTPEGDDGESIFRTDLIIITIPPQLRAKPKGFYLEQISSLKGLIAKAAIPRVIYTSATSVYPDVDKEVFESDRLTTENTGNPDLLEVENLLWKDKTYDLTIIRLGGLLGDDRIPGKYQSGKEGVVGHVPVNYIYRQDAVKLVDWIIGKSLYNKTFNGVSPSYPLRKDVYEKNARVLGFPPPLSYESPPASRWKKVSSWKIRQTGFTFQYDPLNFPYNSA